MERILLIDGMNAVHRASVVVNAFKNSKNKAPDEHNIAFNFFRSFRLSVEVLKPSKVFFVLEGNPKFRYELFPEYKANRIVKTAEQASKKDKVYEASKLIVKLLKHLPVSTCHANEFEADDVIASLCKNLSSEHVTILSNDSDYLQLLQLGYKNVQIFNPIKKEYASAMTYPYLAWKCLAGDKADNIPSIVSKKVANELVVNPSKFEEFLSSEENFEKFSLNKNLIEFKAVPYTSIRFSHGSKDYKTLKEEFEKLDFKTIVEDKYWQRFTETIDSLKVITQ